MPEEQDTGGIRPKGYTSQNCLKFKTIDKAAKKENRFIASEGWLWSPSPIATLLSMKSGQVLVNAHEGGADDESVMQSIRRP